MKVITKEDAITITESCAKDYMRDHLAGIRDLSIRIGVVDNPINQIFCVPIYIIHKNRNTLTIWNAYVNSDGRVMDKQPAFKKPPGIKVESAETKSIIANVLNTIPNIGEDLTDPSMYINGDQKTVVFKRFWENNGIVTFIGYMFISLSTNNLPYSGSVDLGENYIILNN